MTNRTAITLVMLLVIVGMVLFWQSNRGKDKVKEEATQSVSAFNQTKNSNAASVSATADDIIVYSLNVENPNNKVISGFVIEVNIGDVNELATLTDAEGANYNSATNSLIWTPLDIPTRDSIQKKFTVKVKNEFPANSDLVMKVKFNNEVAVDVARTQVQAPVSQSGPGSSPGEVASNNNANTGKIAGKSYASPKTGPSSDLSFILALAATAGIFIFRLKRRTA